MWPNSQFPADLVAFTKEIVNGRPHFLHSVYWNHTSAWVFYCKFAAYFCEQLFRRTSLEGYFWHSSEHQTLKGQYFYFFKFGINLKSSRNSKCDALSDLVPFAQFKDCEKHPWWSVILSKVAGFSLQLY